MAQSHPTWVRGLKLTDLPNKSFGFVAPYVGAWIETAYGEEKGKQFASHPTWVRGLKPSR